MMYRYNDSEWVNKKNKMCCWWGQSNVIGITHVQTVAIAARRLFGSFIDEEAGMSRRKAVDPNYPRSRSKFVSRGNINFIHL